MREVAMMLFLTLFKRWVCFIIPRTKTAVKTMPQMTASLCSAKLLRFTYLHRFLPGAVVAKLGRLWDAEGRPPTV